MLITPLILSTPICVTDVMLFVMQPLLVVERPSKSAQTCSQKYIRTQIFIDAHCILLYVFNWCFSGWENLTCIWCRGWSAPLNPLIGVCSDETITSIMSPSSLLVISLYPYALVRKDVSLEYCLKMVIRLSLRSTHPFFGSLF